MEKKIQWKKLVKKMIFFLAPFIIWFFIELVILPIDHFTFRVWETVLVKDVKILPGPFYPNKVIRKTEEGELAPHTKFAVKKDVVWYTDQFGYRNRNIYSDPDVLIIGDSNITGVNLTQENTLSEALERSLDKTVYSFAPAHINRFLADERFEENPPEIVVFSSIERMIVSLPEIEPSNFKSKLRGAIGPIIVSSDFLTSLFVSLDRILKWPSYYFLRSKIYRGDKELPFHVGSQFFIRGDTLLEVSEERFERSIRVIESYKNIIEARGSRFIFLPIPDKENIYHQLLPTKRKPDFLPRLTKVLKEKNIEVVDLQPAFERSYESGNLVFFTDDGHWNPTGVKIATELLEEQISNK